RGRAADALFLPRGRGQALMLAPKPLFSLVREGHEEVCVFGEVAVARGQSAPAASASRFPARSLLKPFQFLATGEAARGPLAPEQVYALGSISGTPAQLAELERGAASHELGAHVHLPEAWPLGAESRAARRAAGAGPSRLCHPCYSKHLAILAACRRQGWPLDGYTSREHPFHARLLELLAGWLGREPAELAFVTDGCRLPTPLLEPGELARLYRALAAAPDGSELGRLRQAMVDHPERIGGPERVDTRLMQ